MWSVCIPSGHIHCVRYHGETGDYKTLSVDRKYGLSLRVFLQPYGHSFHVTNTKMRNFLCNDALTNVAAKYMETERLANRPILRYTVPTKRALPPHFHLSPFKKMIDLMLNCDATLKDEVISTFMGNSLFKSGPHVEVLLVQCAPSAVLPDNLRIRKRIPILDYISLMPMQTTLFW